MNVKKSTYNIFTRDIPDTSLVSQFKGGFDSVSLETSVDSQTTDVIG